jgi:hypothetical protein
VIGSIKSPIPQFRHQRTSLRRGCLFVAVVLTALAAPASGASGQGVYNSISLGKQWGPEVSGEGLPMNTQIAAEAFANAFQSLGFDNTLYNNGSTATTVTRQAALDTGMAFFAHSAAAVMILKEPPPGGTVYNQAQIMSARVPPPSTTFDGASVTSWDAWGRPVLDKMKFIIMGGCQTADSMQLDALSNTWYGSWFEDGALQGVDNIVAWHGNPLCPQNRSNTACNYYFSRAATYASSYYSIGNALDAAAVDTYNAAGTDYGWGNWAVGGLAPRPWTTNFAPGIGTPVAAEVATDASVTQSFPRIVATADETEELSLNDAPYVDHISSLGGLYRTNASGDLVLFSVPPMQEGAVSTTYAEAESTARGFLENHVPSFDPAAFQLISTEEMDRVPGDSIVEFEWAVSSGGAAEGPRRVFARVDRISGEVIGVEVYAAVPSATEFEISRRAAEEIALASVSGDVRSVSASVWTRPTWRVTISNPAAELLPTAATVEIDGVTGEVRSVGTS